MAHLFDRRHALPRPSRRLSRAGRRRAGRGLDAVPRHRDLHLRAAAGQLGKSDPDQRRGPVGARVAVGIDEADIKLNKVSVTSPIARALIGKFAGDVVEVQAPSGPREYEILEVRYV